MGSFDIPADRRLQLSTFGPFSRVMAHLYSDLDVIPPPQKLKCPSGLQKMVGLIYKALKKDLPEFEKESIGLEVRWDQNAGDSNSVIIGYSGGVDSIAAAIKYQQEGKTPRFVHVTGINKSYPKEVEYARGMAKELKIPLEEVHASGFGKSSYIESPVKDQLIMAIMADCGLDSGIYQFASGIHYTNVASASNIISNWSDTKEMCDAFNEWVSGVWPGYSWLWPIKNRSNALRILKDYKEGLLYKTMSCMTPHRFQKMRREANREKFKANIPDNRCGTCWKCCLDYLHFVGFGIEKPNFEFIDYCVKRSRETTKVVYGTYFDDKSDVELISELMDPDYVDRDVILQYVK